MARHYLRSTQAHAEAADPGTSIDDLIRPGLSRAFPVPDKAESDNERFSWLLEALAQQRQESR